MLQIKDTLVSLDLIEKFFSCNLDACLGQCCIEGDAGAPLTQDEKEAIDQNIDRIMPMLTPAAQRTIQNEGIAYLDQDGDLVTQIVDGRDCVFTCYAEGGKCLCALEKASRQGLLPPLKPSSCHLYPVRIKEYDGFTAVNLHQWKICKSAFTCGRSSGIRAYEFLKEPLTKRFGKEWYDELDLTAREYLRQRQDMKKNGM